MTTKFGAIALALGLAVVSASSSYGGSDMIVDNSAQALPPRTYHYAPPPPVVYYAPPPVQVVVAPTYGYYARPVRVYGYHRGYVRRGYWHHGYWR
jgi:hypothetical protein